VYGAAYRPAAPASGPKMVKAVNIGILAVSKTSSLTLLSFDSCHNKILVWTKSFYSDLSGIALEKPKRDTPSAASPLIVLNRDGARVHCIVLVKPAERGERLTRRFDFDFTFLAVRRFGKHPTQTPQKLFDEKLSLLLLGLVGHVISPVI
jgi:hypothetical protein